MKRMENNEKKLEKVKYDLSNFKDIKIKKKTVEKKERFIPKSLEVSLIFSANDLELLYDKAEKKGLTLVQYLYRQIFK